MENHNALHLVDLFLGAQNNNATTLGMLSQGPGRKFQAEVLEEQQSFWQEASPEAPAMRVSIAMGGPP